MKIRPGSLFPAMPPEEREWRAICEQIPGSYFNYTTGPNSAYVTLPSGICVELHACGNIRTLILTLFNELPGPHDVILRDILR